jgi:hypothetical protein
MLLSSVFGWMSESGGVFARSGGGEAVTREGLFPRVGGGDAAAWGGETVLAAAARQSISEQTVIHANLLRAPSLLAVVESCVVIQ